MVFVLQRRALSAVGLVVIVGCAESDPVANDSPQPPIAWVVVSPGEASVARSGSFSFTATTSRGGAIAWFASDTLIATVIETDGVNGRATIRGQSLAGTTAICAKSGADPAVVGCASIRVTN